MKCTPALLVLSLLLMTSCKGKDTSAVPTQADAPGDSPKATIQAFLEVMNTGKRDELTRFFPTSVQLSKAFECPGSDTIGQANARYIKRAGERFDKARAKGAKYSKLQVAPPKKSVELAAGTEFKGCKVKVAVSLAKIRIAYFTDYATERDDDEDTDVKMIQLDGRWYFRKAPSL